MSKDIRRALMIAKGVTAPADDSHPATQIPGVHISERTHGKPIFTGERIGKADGGRTSKFKLPPIRPASDNIDEVLSSSMDHGRHVGSTLAPLASLSGGVDLRQPDQRRRVDSLKTAMASPSGYISRLIVDDAGNVLEGQHRLEALRELGAEHAPVHRIADLSRGLDMDGIRAAINRARPLHPDHVTQLVNTALDNIHDEGGSVQKVRDNWEPPRGFEEPYNAVLDEVERQRTARPAKGDGGSLTGQDQDGEDGITAYQGGPHSVGPEGYSNDKIGTGEGTLAEGYGHYFAEHEPVAQSYRDTLSHRDQWLRATPHLNAKNWVQKFGGDADYAANIMRDQLKGLSPDDDNAERLRQTLHFIETGKHAEDLPAAGHMHQVRIAARPEHLLDWDKPLQSQSWHVQKAIEDAPDDVRARIFPENQASHTGASLYGRLAETYEDKHSPREAKRLASEALSSLGIRGVQYLDKLSRGVGQGTRNYVVFDPKHIDIQRRYARGGMAYADGGSLPDAGVQKALDLTRDLNPQGLYSHAAEAALASPQAKGPLPQMLASLKGVKPDELKYSGVNEQFAGQPRVTREELAQHFQKGLPDIQETTMRQGVNKNIAKYGGYTLPGGENYREILMHLPDGPSNYASPHWRQQPNVLAHLRLKDRVGPNGEKILHAEEVQSDWGQQARRDGTYNAARPYQVFEPNTGKVLSEHTSFEEARDEAKKHEDAGNYGIDYGHAIDTHTDKEPVPDAPYIGNTQNWTDLALKRLLHEAAAGGYDKVVYTPGVEQAKRYGKEDSSGMEGYYDKVLPKSLLALAKQHDPEAKLEAHQVPGVKSPAEEKSSDHQRLEELAGGELSEAQVDVIRDYLLNDREERGFVRPDAFEDALNHAMRTVPDKPSDISFPGLTITPRMRESILKKGFKAYARGGDVENTMRIAKAGGGPLGDDEAVKKALALTAQAQAPAPQQAVQAARRISTPTPAVNPASPLMEQAFQTENRPGVVVSPRPGKGSGPPITREMPKNVPDIYKDFPVYSDHPDLQYENEPWNPSTPNLIGAPRPSPVQEPVRETPRMKNVTRSVQKIFKTKGFNDLIEDITKTPTSPGIRNLEVTPIQGTWKKELEPSFILHHPDMTDAHAAAIAPVLGFGKLQDASIRTEHNPSIEDGTPAALIGHSNGISEAKLRKIAQLSGEEGLDFSQTKDGKAVKYLHFGKEHEYPEFLDKVNRIADAAGLPERGTARASTELINAKDYLPRIFGENSSGEGLPAAAKRSPDLFRRIVDHVLAPYAKAIAGEGYRLSPERLQEAYGLTDEETDHVRTALYPGKKGDRTTVPLMTGEEDLDVRPTGGRGQANVNDVMYALQNRAARQGQIDPGDFSDTAKENISKDIASEVAHHVNNSDKSAIGWYDKALKAAMDAYSAHFPQLKTDPDKKMLFHALLGITSQGQNVHENSAHAVRLFDLMENHGMTLPQAVDRLEGTFGDKTRAIEHNLLKFDHLVKNNGYDKMRDVFNQKMSVAEWRKKLKSDPTLFDLNGKPFSVSGKSNQQVTGWSVFGPKIGSFINNLHGDYSTLTADLWFSRTWGRLLGHNFMHTPAQEADQYRDFRDALKAERMHSPAAESLQNRKLRMDPSFKTSDGKLRIDPATGKPKGWLYGDDAKKLSEDEYQNALGDPEAMLELAKGLHKEFKDSGYKDKSDLRRRAKNWIENRENSVAAPRSDNERGFQQDTVEQAQKLLKNKYGLDISVADIQAALWFHEKELFGKYGVASEKAQPADYADAARGTLDLIQSGNLYNVQSKEPKAPKKAPLPKKADGGTVDAALKLVSQYGQPLPDAVNLARQHTRGRP